MTRDKYRYETTSSVVEHSERAISPVSARPPSGAARCRSAKPHPSASSTSRWRRFRSRNSRQTLRFDGRSHGFDVDDAVAHHAAIVEDVFGRHQPVADVKREQAILPRARDLRHQIRIPPDVIDVERDAERARALRIDLIANIQRLLRRIHAGAIGSVGRMQRLDRERHAAPLAHTPASQRWRHRTCARACTMSFEAALPGREYCGRPPATSTTHGAPSALASSIARRLSSRTSVAARRVRRKHAAAAVTR